MRCVICKEGMIQPGTTVTLERGQTTLVINDVPAQVCENCSEAYVDDVISDELLGKAEEVVQTGVLVDVRMFAAV